MWTWCVCVCVRARARVYYVTHYVCALYDVTLMIHGTYHTSSYVIIRHHIMHVQTGEGENVFYEDFLRKELKSPRDLKL